MNEFFESLTILEKVFFVCAAVGGILFMIRLLLQFIGHDSDMFHDVDGFHTDGLDADGDIDSDASFKLLTFQGLTSFFMMFGLVGLALMRQSKVGGLLAIVGGLAAGAAAVWIIAKLFTLMLKLQSSGTVDNEGAVGAEGTVYLRIPANGTGKVQVRNRDRLREYDAVTEDEEDIQTGDRVRVVKIVSGNVMVVEKI